MVAYLVQAPEIHAIAAKFPVRQPGDYGRPDAFPPIVWIIFQAMQFGFRSKRRTDLELSHPAAWKILWDGLAHLYPGYPCFQPGSRHRPNRHGYARFRNKHTACQAVWEAVESEACAQAADQAEGMGMMNVADGTNTFMAGHNVAAGDGTVIRPRSFHTPTQRQLENGIPVGFRHEPDALVFHTGTGERVLGTKWVTLMATNRHEDERVVLGIANQPHNRDGGEAAVALDLIGEAKSHLPGMQGIAWDKALRGTHIDWLYQLGLQTVVKVHRVRGEAKSRNLGNHVIRRAGQIVGEQPVYAVGGAPGINIIVAGKQHWVRCQKVRVAFEENRNGSKRVYGIYRVPDEPQVPPKLRDGEFRVRYDNGGKTSDPTLNRAEVVRPVVEDDADHEGQWGELYHLRPGTESFNKWLKDRLPNGLAPSYTVNRQRFDLLGAQLYANARAAIAYRHRHGRPDCDNTGPPARLTPAA